jgi:hypothetical protein
MNCRFREANPRVLRVSIAGEIVAAGGWQYSGPSEIWLVGARKVDRSAHMIDGAVGADEFRPIA